MSWYQMHRAVYDWVRVGEVNSDAAAGEDPRASFDVSVYELTHRRSGRRSTIRTSRPSISSVCTKC